MENLGGKYYHTRQLDKSDIYITFTIFDLIHVCQCVLYFVCLFCCFTSQVNSYGHGGTVSSPNNTFPGQA